MTRKKAIWIFALTFFIVVLPVSWLLVFFYSNKAPITIGTIAYGVPYKDGKTLDIYYPTRPTDDRSPVVLFIHGGAWIGGRKEAINLNRINGAVNELRERGYTIISPEYTLAREEQSPFPLCIEDIFHAKLWVAAHADSLNLDLTNFGVIGESAGAHLAMITSFATPAQFGIEADIPTVRYVVDIYGPVDLWSLYHSQSVDSLQNLIGQLPQYMQESLDLPKRLFGFNPREDSIRTREFTARYSPLGYLSKSSPPLLMIHGNADRVVPFQQSMLLKQALDSLGVANHLHILDRVDHAFLGATDGQRDSIQHYVSDFIVNQYHGN